MYEWNETVQLMVDWVERHLTEDPSLMNMSKQMGYSPYYCSRQFNALTGMTLRDYIWMRKVSRAALELRDTDERVLDIAVKYGFSSQEAFTRAFVRAFGVTPYAYRQAPKPIPLAMRVEVFSPYHYYMKERDQMNQGQMQQVEVRKEFIEAHKFIGVWDISSQNYMQFWETGMIAMRSAVFWRVCLIRCFLGIW